MIDKEMKLSEHFTLGEMTRTKTRIENVPNEGQVENLKWLCRWLEMLRSEWNKRYGDGDDPIIITSGFRCKEVNEAVGGSPQSNHLAGCAADIRCAGIEQALRYATIILDISLTPSPFGAFPLIPEQSSPTRSLSQGEGSGYLLPLRKSRDESRETNQSQTMPMGEPFDELIIEKKGYNYWVHFAVRPEHNRWKVLLLQK